MKDYIIVGLGLSGMTMAEELHKRNKSFMVISDQSQKASVVAGGIINPLVLKRFTKTWKAGEFIPKATTLYKKMEDFLNSNFLREISIYRKFTSAREQNDWIVNADKAFLSPFMDERLQVLETVQSKFGYGKVKQTSVLRTEKLISAYRDFLLGRNALCYETFKYSALKIEQDCVLYKNFKAKKIIFCEGFGMLQNPWFKTLPLQGNKGEYLIIKSPGLNLNVIVKSAVFLIPLGHDDLYKVGSSYQRQFSNQEPEEGTRQTLIEKLERLIDCPYKIVAQVAAVRPTVKDRRPLLGHHRDHKNLYVCNGFGSRGVMIAPTAAEWLIDYSENGKALPKEVDIARFL